MKSNYNNKVYSKGKANRGRKTNKYIFNIFILIIIFVSLSIFVNVSFAKDKLETTNITVEYGTTLWNIASNICNDNPKLNIQNVIIEIKRLNNIENSMIYEGQNLIIYKY